MFSDTKITSTLATLLVKEKKAIFRDHVTEEAASMLLVFLTAWNMLVTNARLGVGETVLLWGGRQRGR